jgi:hypothetical protein
MYFHLAIHRPYPEKKHLMLDSMRRLGEALKQQPGLREVYQLEDANSGALVGLAIWDSEEDLKRARPIAWEVIKNDDHEAWEPAPPQVFSLTKAK